MQNLLRDKALVERIYSHPLVRGLHLNNRRPSYIPSRVFALALLDRLTPDGQVPDAASVKTALSDDSVPVKAALRILMADADNSYEKFVENVEVWFNQGMERVSGWYRRYTQGILVALAVPLTMMLNADSLDIGCAVWKDPTIRAALVAQADTVDASPPPPPAEPEELRDVLVNADAYVASLRAVRLPLGWAQTSLLPTRSAAKDGAASSIEQQRGEEAQAALSALYGCRTPGPRPDSVRAWLVAVGDHWLGWFITVLAISLGSPFWFDLSEQVHVHPRRRQVAGRSAEEPQAGNAGARPRRASGRSEASRRDSRPVDDVMSARALPDANRDVPAGGGFAAAV